MKDNQLMKALQLFAEKDLKRPLLRCAHIQDGKLTVTNSHVALRKPSKLPNLTIDLFSLETQDGNYPSTDNLFDFAGNEALLSVATIKELYTFIKNHKRKSDVIHFHNEGKLTVSAYDNQQKVDREGLSLEGIGFDMDTYYTGVSAFAIFNYLYLNQQEAYLKFKAPLWPTYFSQGKSELLVSPFNVF